VKCPKSFGKKPHRRLPSGGECIRPFIRDRRDEQYAMHSCVGML